MAPGQSLPKLRALNQLTKTSFDRIYDYLMNDMFQRFPPLYIVADYTNEKTFSDWLVRKYGKDKVELISFSQQTKLMLKEDGRSVLLQGYKFPNPAKMKDRKAAKLVGMLIQQLKHEQLLQTRTGKTTFDHPSIPLDQTLKDFHLNFSLWINSYEITY